jgi:peptidoglycan/xylan/chitin deacetylase (PgdA/CDA1 family)
MADVHHIPGSLLAQMDHNTLRVCFTMDCEQIAALAYQGGPETWELGERAIHGYCETLRQAGLWATLFVVPQGADRYRKTLQQWADAGIEVGLHYHPQDHGYPEYFGACTSDEQEVMLREAIEHWSQQLGLQPMVFRPGNFSASDATFPTLVRLGFRAGSVSLPLRNFTQARANWVGAPLDPHFAHPANRLLAGELDFLEVPVTVDWESMVWGGRTPLDLRIELVDSRSHGFTIRKAVQRQLDSGVPPTVVVYTHNIFDYSDRSEFRRKVLDGIIEEIGRTAELHDLNLQPFTLMGLRQLMLREAQPAS